MPIESTCKIMDIGQFYLDGKPIGQIQNVELVSESTEHEHIRKLGISTSEPVVIEGDFEFKLPKKYNKKTLKFYRKYLFIDLLVVNHPRKKNRRKKRIERKWKEFYLSTMQILKELNKNQEETGLISEQPVT